MKKETQELIENFFKEHTSLQSIRENITAAIEPIIVAFKRGNKLLACGNGGSGTDADRISSELMKAFVKPRPLSDEIKKAAKKLYGTDGEFIANNLQQGLPAISLGTPTALMTAFLNDCNPDLLYAQQVNSLMKKGDILIAISTSGNSKNILYAARTAKILGGTVIALSGKTGGSLKVVADINIISPQTETYKIQEDHLPIYHLICRAVESEIF